MVATYYLTCWLSNIYLLLLVRIILASSLYFAVMKLLRVKILEECLTFMKKKKNGKLETILIVFGMIVCVIVTVGGWFVRQDYLFGQTADGFIIRQRVRPGTPVTLVYRHSVQKTMIHEYLEVNDMATGLVLKSTKYQSMGVGLPFSKEDGDFREEDGWFILDNMNRPYPELSIRNGVTNEEKVYVGDTEYDLASLMPLGKELHLYVAPLYQVLYKKKEIRS